MRSFTQIFQPCCPCGASFFKIFSPNFGSVAQLRYSSTPLPGPFPPLAKQRTGQLSRALAPQSSSTSLGTGTIISDAPSATSVRTRHSGALETLRVHLPLGTSPRVSHRYDHTHVCVPSRVQDAARAAWMPKSFSVPSVDLHITHKSARF